jgi:hypothetical protein
MLNPEVVKSFVKSMGDHFFVVKFIKKNGQQREMLCRKGVKKGLADPANPQLPSYINCPDIVGVWDIKAGGYRSFSVDRVVYISGNGMVLSAK